MKNVLFATSALVALSAGGAALADGHEGGISFSGDARLGLVYADGIDTNGDGLTNGDDDDLFGTSRARVKVTASGTSDAGINFGFNFRIGDADSADNQAGVANPAPALGQSPGVSTKGEVFVGGSFGTLTYGDTDTGLEKRVSNVDAISLTGLGDRNEIARQTSLNPQIRYDYDFDSFGISLSTQGDLESFAVGVGGTFDFGSNSVSVGIGYDDAAKHIAASLGAGFGPVDVKVAYATGDTVDMDLAVSLGYSSGALSLAGFYHMSDAGGTDLNSYGVGMAYDLGGGLELKTGVAANDADVLTADLGFAMTF
ncbi:porin [Halovulum sp. GXIMD14793]